MCYYKVTAVKLMDKKILFYFNSMSGSGGIERVIANLTDVLSNHYKIYILTKDDCPSFYNLNPKVVKESLHTPLIMKMRYRCKRIIAVTYNFCITINKLKKYLSMLEPDYIYTATPMTALEIWILGSSYKKKLVISEHASYYAYNKIYKAIKTYIYPKAYCIAAPTQMDTKIYLEMGCSAIYIPHLSTFEHPKKHPMDKHIALNIGRLTADKQQLLLLHMWKEISASISDTWVLKIIGDGEEHEALSKYILENKLSNVELIPATTEISQYYKEASIFLFTSFMEGFGMVLLEAMAYGVPCISFDCPSGPRDIIKNGKNGWLVDCYDAKQYIKQSILLMNNLSLLETMSMEAIDTIEKWDNQQIIKLWNKVFRETTNEI